jgi:hypothetical protein
VNSRIMVLLSKVTEKTPCLTARRKLTREHSTTGKRLVAHRYWSKTVSQCQADMRIKLGLLNVSFEYSLFLDMGKVSGTLDVSTGINKSCMSGYQSTHITCWRTSIKETKAYPTICTPIHYANWRYPKRKRRNRLWSQDLNIPHGYGAFVVVKYGNAVIMAKGRSYCVPKQKLIREENLK